MQTEPYTQQKALWPDSGRHILAQFDDETIFVYQAYQPSIGLFAARHQYFGGDFSYNRMSWIKPNFMWMMYRSGWGTKPGQEITLAIRLKRNFFDTLLEQAVPSSFDPEQYATKEMWQTAVKQSEVRLQWDPDHAPSGAALERRAIQLGLRGSMLREYGRNAIVEIMDMSDFVQTQRQFVEARDYENLICPTEDVYLPANLAIRQRLRLNSQVKLYDK